MDTYIIIIRKVAARRTSSKVETMGREASYTGSFSFLLSFILKYSTVSGVVAWSEWSFNYVGRLSLIRHSIQLRITSTCKSRDFFSLSVGFFAYINNIM